MTPLNRIKAKIYSVCPEKKELTFGCEIRPKYRSTIKASKAKHLYFTHFKQCDVCCVDELGQVQTIDTYWHNQFLQKDKKPDQEDILKEGYHLNGHDYEPLVNNIEILGHSLGLQEVLRACEEAGRPMCVTSDGHIRFVVRNEGASEEMVVASCEYDPQWNLLAPLDTQSTETIDFLYSLICEKS